MVFEIGCILRCGRIRRTRGLCTRCYSRAKAAVARGETTWLRLQAEGRAIYVGRVKVWSIKKRARMLDSGPDHWQD